MIILHRSLCRVWPCCLPMAYLALGHLAGWQNGVWGQNCKTVVDIKNVLSDSISILKKWIKDQRPTSRALWAENLPLNVSMSKCHHDFHITTWLTSRFCEFCSGVFPCLLFVADGYIVSIIQVFAIPQNTFQPYGFAINVFFTINPINLAGNNRAKIVYILLMMPNKVGVLVYISFLLSLPVSI